MEFAQVQWIAKIQRADKRLEVSVVWLRCLCFEGLVEPKAFHTGIATDMQDWRNIGNEVVGPEGLAESDFESARRDSKAEDLKLELQGQMWKGFEDIVGGTRLGWCICILDGEVDLDYGKRLWD